VAEQLKYIKIEEEQDSFLLEPLTTFKKELPVGELANRIAELDNTQEKFNKELGFSFGKVIPKIGGV